MFQKASTATFIGHRECYEMDQQLLKAQILRLIASGIDTFLSGGMGRFDAVCEHTVAACKQQYPHIGLYLILPYPTFQPKHRWEGDASVYPEGFERYSYKAAIPKRNQYLVDRSSHALCYVKYPWGGAAATYAYAKRKGITLIDIP